MPVCRLGNGGFLPLPNACPRIGIVSGGCLEALGFVPQPNLHRCVADKLVLG
jgi:hypothetical protein